MRFPFVNRQLELKELDQFNKKRGLFVIYGRRRIGKTRLLNHWLDKNRGFYSQAIEATKEVQISQLYQDIKDHLTTSIEPKTWLELFELLNLEKRQLILCIDEFPYLVATDPSLPSLLQKWYDQQKTHMVSLILCGSSYHMMHDIFLNRVAPLFGRSHKIMCVGPMSYEHFCEACALPPQQTESFLKFSLVGGVPRYWEFLNKKNGILDTAKQLYFDFAPYMENEPMKLLRDEKVSGIYPLSVLEILGRGASKPSEIASRLGVPQTQISKVLYRLIDTQIVKREVPFSQSEKNPKNVLYTIEDPSLRFWFQVYSPHRSRWTSYQEKQQRELIHTFAGSIFEDYCRGLFINSSRYWEKDNEFDLLHLDGKDKLTVAEVKFSKLSAKTKKNILKNLKEKWQTTKLAKKHPHPNFEVFDQSILNTNKK